MPSDAPAHMLALAVDLAQAAGVMMRERRLTARSGRKSDGSVVTDVDVAVEALITDGIRAQFPDHAIIGEENHQTEAGSARFTWVVDPIDGTRNYVAGFPCYSTAIAVLDEGRPVVGVVYDPNISLVCSAAESGGTFVNGERVRTRDRPDGQDLMVGAPSNKDALTVAVLARWLAMPGIIYRNNGSTALQLALVACGALSATFARRCKIWDLAAGAILVLEAGGSFSDPFGRRMLPFDLTLDSGVNLPFLAGAPLAHEYLVDSISDLKD